MKSTEIAVEGLAGVGEVAQLFLAVYNYKYVWARLQTMVTLRMRFFIKITKMIKISIRLAHACFHF